MDSPKTLQEAVDLFNDQIRSLQADIEKSKKLGLLNVWAARKICFLEDVVKVLEPIARRIAGAVGNVSREMDKADICRRYMADKLYESGVDQGRFEGLSCAYWHVRDLVRPAPLVVEGFVENITPLDASKGAGTPLGTTEVKTSVGAESPVSQSVRGCNKLTNDIIGNGLGEKTTDRPRPTTSEASNDR